MSQLAPRSFPVNESLPPREPHAVSVSMPTWQIVHEYVHKIAKVSPLTRGYPRIFIPLALFELGSKVVARYGRHGADALPFPTAAAARRCVNYLEKLEGCPELGIIPLRLPEEVRNGKFANEARWAEIFVVIYPTDLTKKVKEYWRYAGEGISSRHNQLMQELYPLLESPRDEQHRTEPVPEKSIEVLATLNLEQSERARQSLTTLIAQAVSSNDTFVESKDVFLYPTGMCAIYHTAMAMKKASSVDCASSATMFGFPYTDTFKVISKVVWTDCDFYGKGDAADLNTLEETLASGRKICALFCEFPSNPLLETPDLVRIHSLARKYDFMVACDDTVGTFVNVDLLPYVDVLMTSLTKAASGVGNVMGGSLVISPYSPQRGAIHAALRKSQENIYFPQDLVLMMNNCIDMVPRIRRFGETTSIFAKWLKAQAPVKTVYYPSLVPSKKHYDQHLKRQGGYGYLLSIEFHQDEAAMAFYDNLDVAKGPSLGLNFTLATAYTLLGHHDELDWAAAFGVSEFLVRISFGLESLDELFAVFAKAMDSARAASRPEIQP